MLLAISISIVSYCVPQIQYERKILPQKTLEVKLMIGEK